MPEKQALKITREELRDLQSLPLELKIGIARERIMEWYEHWNGDVVVSFSGGMDSTVLLHLVRTIYPHVEAICATALLYPEIRTHIKNIENVIMVRPKIAFKEVIERCGYPVIGRRQAQYIKEVQRAKGETATKILRLTGIRSDGTYSPMSKLPDKWHYLCDAPFRISDKCCYFLKEKPLDIASNGKVPFIGIRVQESAKRKESYLQYSCNAFDISKPRSWPLAFWTDQDVWDYVREFNVPYSRIYDMGYTRTGCFACMFGVHLEKEPNRFQRMQVTHPQLWKACEKWGIPEVLDYIGVSYEPPKQDALFEIASSGKVFNKWNEKKESKNGC